jgi:hypothetical protein
MGLRYGRLPVVDDMRRLLTEGDVDERVEPLSSFLAEPLSSFLDLDLVLD